MIEHHVEDIANSIIEVNGGEEYGTIDDFKGLIWDGLKEVHEDAGID